MTSHEGWIVLENGRVIRDPAAPSIRDYSGWEREVSIEKPIKANKHFFQKIVCLGDVDGGVRRFVAAVDLDKMQEILDDAKQTEDDFDVYMDVATLAKENDVFVRIWEPQDADDPYNLVLSLCTDGMHRPLFDLDYGPEVEIHDMPNYIRLIVTENGGRQETKLRKHGGTATLFESTNNKHLYMGHPTSFSGYQEMLASLPGEDARKYAANVATQGYGTLRPPWIKKKQEDEQFD